MSEWIDTVVARHPLAQARQVVWSATAGRGLAWLRPCGIEGHQWSAALVGPELGTSTAKALSRDSVALRVYNFYSVRVVQAWADGKLRAAWVNEHCSDTAHELRGVPTTLESEPADPVWAELFGAEPNTDSADALVTSLGVCADDVWLSPDVAAEQCLRWSTLSILDDEMPAGNVDPALFYYDKRTLDLSPDRQTITATLTNTGGVAHDLLVRAFDGNHEVRVVNLTVRGSAGEVTLDKPLLHVPLAAGLELPPPSLATASERDESLQAWDTRRLVFRIETSAPVSHLQWETFGATAAASRSWQTPSPSDVFTTPVG